MDITTLPVDLKRELAKHLFLKKKVKEANTLFDWKPWDCRHNGTHVSQSMAFKSTAKRVIILGGNRSGKTEDGAATIAHMFCGTHPYRENRVPCMIKVIAEDFPTLGKVIIPKLLRFIPPSAIKSVRRNERGVIVQITGNNESVIDVMSYDQDVTKFESFDADVAWFDEPPPKDVYDGVRRGLIDRRGIEIFTMTPLREPWIYNTFYIPWLEGRLRDTDIFELMSYCNPHISTEELDSLKDVYDEETLKARLEGKFRHLAGVIYPIDRAVHVVGYFDWPITWPVHMCIDPHPKKPHAVTWMGITPHDQKIIIDELKYAGPISELSIQIKAIETKNRYRVVDRLIDTSIKAIDRQDQRKALANSGVRCRFPHKYDRVLPGIEKVQQALYPKKDHEGKPYSELLFRDNCRGHLKEISSYVWDDAGEKPRKQEDDYMDNVRYLIDSEPKYNFISKPLDYVQSRYSYGR